MPTARLFASLTDPDTGKTYTQHIDLDDDGFYAYDNEGWRSRYYSRERDAEVACDDRAGARGKQETP